MGGPEQGPLRAGGGEVKADDVSGVARELVAAGFGDDKVAGGAADLLSLDLNDDGNARRLIILHAHRLRYCHDFRKWLVYDGLRWALDESEQALKLQKHAMARTARLAIDRNVPAVLKWASRSLDRARLVSALALAQPEICVRAAELDSDPDLLNCLNGTINLKSGELLPHDPKQLITRLVHHRFETEARCPRFLGFLGRIMGAHPDASEAALTMADRKVGYLQRALGYSLTGRTSEKAVFVVYGERGDNGKTTLLFTVAQVVAEYSVLIQIESLMGRRESTNDKADLADLRGKRFVRTSEGERGQRLQQARLKRITQGMGMIKAVRKYENPIEFPETHKLWIDTNPRPVIHDVEDEATFKRLHPIPFDVTIPPEEIDRELPAKLAEESEGILAWLVAGALEWYRCGLQRIAEVDQARRAWREKDDQIGRWIEERCEVDEAYRTRASVLFEDYKRWTVDAAEQGQLSRNDFGRRLESRGFSKVHRDDGNHYNGLRLLPCS
ncbi:MAG: hypothetical protein C0504_19540 [Candidatus Solibacter sp.]|nr:hypothetical protein [Candidatus Solibacter sp.]